MIGEIVYRLFTKKITIAKWQINFIFFLGCVTGIVLSFGYLFNTKFLPQIFAATSPWNQTDWSEGEGGSTVNQYSASSNIDTSTEGEITLSARDDWSEDYASWLYRKKITFDNTDTNLGVTSEALVDFPVLIKLEQDTDIDYTKTQNAGQDIRFTDTDGTVLNYEIEYWNESGSSFVWVKVPQIDINSNTDYIYMYYGNTEASDGQNATGVWDSNFLGVWHANDTSSTTIEDSTTNNKDGTKQSSNNPNYTSSGQIAGAQTYTQSTSRIGTTINTALSDFTVEVWFKDNGTATTYERLADKSYTGCFWLGRNSSTAHSWGGGIMKTTHPYGIFVTLTDNQWHQIATIRSGATHYIYGDGGAVTNTEPASVNACDATNFGIGGYGNGATNTQWFGGTIDEVRISNTARSLAWIAASYHSGTDDFNIFDAEVSKYPSSGTLTSNIFDAGFAADWGTLTYTTSGSGTATVKVRTSNSATMEGATEWSSCSAKTSGNDLSGGCVTDTERYIQYYITLEPSGASNVTFSDISLAFSASDQVRPDTNATNVAITNVEDGAWTKTEPVITWTAGADNEGGGGLAGYCISLDEADPGESNTLDPETSGGKLSGLDDGVVNSATCEYIATGTSLNLSGVSGLTLTSGKQYYISFKAVDLAGNVYTGASGTYQDLVSFRYDDTAPVNVAYISMPSGSFSNVNDMSFSWPLSGGNAASDAHSDVLGYQYQINGTDDEWKGTETSSSCALNYIPADTGSHDLTEEEDGSDVTEGNNVIYFRTIDHACNISASATYRTGNLAYGGDAPVFDPLDTVTITPSDSTSNAFALSWPEATATTGNTVSNYYYMVNTSPPSTLATLTSNATTYIDNATATTVSEQALPNVNKGTNTVYVVAVDNEDNYSSSNYISGTFTLNSTDPDNPGDLVASDSSIKASSQWNVTLTWTAPSYQGAGNLTYLIYRSSDGTSFSEVGSTTGLSYVDNTPASTLYYYKVYSKDGADAQSSGTNAVSITPTGKYTSAPSLESGPTASAITTKTATITWSTSRTSDSKVQYGTTSGSYGSVEPSNSTQVTSHSIQLTGLKAGTTYYYKAKWTDEDGNSGTSSEKSFTTTPAPTVTDPSVKNISISTAIITYTVKEASKVKIYYGTTTGFGAVKEISTSTSETTYTTELSGLADGTKYYYKINTFDSEDEEYEGNTLTFETLPRPKISNVRVQQVANTAQSTLLVTWTTNTEISSIVTYYPENNSAAAKDEVNVALVKGAHRMIVRGLLPQTNYALLVKGRDKIGNEAVSEAQRVTTATDTRPPQIMDLKVEGSQVSSAQNNQLTQLVVTWNTDEPATSQVEFGEGTGTTYAQKTQEDSNLTTNHLVILSGLTPSKVYHLRALSKDKAGNVGQSIDTVSITPKATENALNLVVQNLQEAFGFLGRLTE